MRKMWGNLKFLHDHGKFQISPNHFKLLIMVFKDRFSQNFTILEKIFELITTFMQKYVQSIHP